MESVDRYRSEMMEHIPERDDDTLFNYHKLTVERLMKNVDKAAIREAFMDIVDLNWMKCEELCREKLGLVETRIISAESQGYWTLIKPLYEEYNACIGASLYSKMKFILLEHLDRRQDADFKILMEEKQKREIGLGANATTVQSRAAAFAPASTKGDINSEATRDAAEVPDVADDCYFL